MLIDSHCHLSSVDNISDVIERAYQADVKVMLNAGGKFDELEFNLDICNKFNGIYTVSGVHPHDAKDYQHITSDDVLKTVQYTKEVSELTGLPLCMTTVKKSLFEELSGKIENLMPLDIYVDWKGRL